MTMTANAFSVSRGQTANLTNYLSTLFHQKW